MKRMIAGAGSGVESDGGKRRRLEAGRRGNEGEIVELELEDMLKLMGRVLWRIWKRRRLDRDKKDGKCMYRGRRVQ